MLKKKSLTLKVLVGIVLTMTLCFGLTLSALANPSSGGTETAPAESAVAKVLEMPAGTDTPVATFEFVFTPQRFNGNPVSPTNPVPTINPTGTTPGTVSISFTAADVGTTTAGIKTVKKETSSPAGPNGPNVLAGITWPAAGTYEYTLVETAGTYTSPGLTATPPTEWITYSQAVYNYVVVVAAGTATPTNYYVTDIIATRVTNDDGTSGTGKAGSTPGSSDLIFTNQYAKTTGTDPVTDAALTINKKILSTSTISTTDYFDFTATITAPNLPSITTLPTVYRAYVVSRPDPPGTPTVINPVPGNVLAADGTDSFGFYIEFTSGTAKTVRLAHNQELAFITLPVGSEFAVSEAATASYKAGYTLTINGAVTGSVVNPAANMNLALPAGCYVGSQQNLAAYTNDTNTTPGGINVDTLPYIILIGIALIALIGYLTIRSRRNAYHSV